MAITADHSTHARAGRARGLIEIEPLNGMCNRLRALDSAFALARDLDREVVVHWTDKGMNCPFSDLFEKPAFVSRVVEWRLSRRSDRLRRAAVTAARRLRGQPDLSYQTVNGMLEAGQDFRALIDGHRRLSLATAARFWSGARLFADVVPQRAIRERVATITAQWPRNVVGVHIRRGDNWRAREVSTIERYAAAVRAQIAREPDAAFFVASEGEADEEALRREFGARILALPKQSRLRDATGMPLALADLICLSRTKRILGSYFSSFSETAAEIGGIELQVVS